jgi:hypothetical protein
MVLERKTHSSQTGNQKDDPMSAPTDDGGEFDIPLPDSVDPDEVQEPTAEDIAQQIIDLESQQRLWLAACLKIMQLTRTTGESDAVVRALDSVVIAAAARAKRILGSDGPLERR